MRIGLFLGHPAHFHMLKNTAKALMDNGNEVEFVIKKKDILENLLKKREQNFLKAHVVIDTSALSEEEIVEKILGSMNEANS
jgi:predicted glycosyltransferase